MNQSATQQNKRNCPLFEVPVNRTVPADEELRLNNQAQKILSWLRVGKMTNVQMANIAKQYNARVHEIRKALEPHGFIVPLVEKGKDADGKPTGVNWYELEDVRSVE